ncbi:hypothetical protein AOQ84DRAFT_372348 [Glonium stellatum]|uniref:Uncharacterized protein n=1 Tax=Glonium stellatum TaxID=574774 RepID=A0A8E2FA56_9PEZI|nr:hypothetical protein AOQ84DRAFT_372348 [Glonium stellatum]
MDPLHNFPAAPACTVGPAGDDFSSGSRTLPESLTVTEPTLEDIVNELWKSSDLSDCDAIISQNYMENHTAYDVPQFNANTTISAPATGLVQDCPYPSNPDEAMIHWPYPSPDGLTSKHGTYTVNPTGEKLVSAAMLHPDALDQDRRLSLFRPFYVNVTTSHMQPSHESFS